MVFELVAFSIFILMFVSVLIANLRLLNKNKKISNKLIQFGLDKAMLLEKLDKLSGKQNPIEQTEGFLKFISDSRDWAFKYIEDVQEAIKEFNAAIESKNDQRIEDALNNLKSFLPDNEEENNKNKQGEK
jgi:molecular chaperone DnaK (HSP70)